MQLYLLKPRWDDRRGFFLYGLRMPPTAPTPAPMSTSSVIELPHIPIPADGTPLGAQQQQFNTLIQQIAAQRALLAQWQQAQQDYRRRYAQELLPALRAFQAQLSEHLHWLDAAYARPDLSKADRATLADALARMAADLAQAAQDPAIAATMTALHQRYAPADAHIPQVQEHGYGTHTGTPGQEAAQGVDMDLDTEIDLNDPDALQRYAEQQEAQWQAQQARAEAARAAHHRTRQRKPSAQERQAQAAAQQASQSVRAVYRKLASALHPDREPDPAERARKTVLMQRANQAYADQQLLELLQLQLQLEIEHIDAAHLARASEERLQHYRHILSAQLQELQAEVQSLRAQLLPWVPGPSKPSALRKLLRAHLQQLRQDSLHLQDTMRALQTDPQALKAWIKAQRHGQKAQDF